MFGEDEVGKTAGIESDDPSEIDDEIGDIGPLQGAIAQGSAEIGDDGHLNDCASENDQGEPQQGVAGAEFLQNPAAQDGVNPADQETDEEGNDEGDEAEEQDSSEAPVGDFQVLGGDVFIEHHEAHPKVEERANQSGRKNDDAGDRGDAQLKGGAPVIADDGRGYTGDNEQGQQFGISITDGCSHAIVGEVQGENHETDQAEPNERA